MRSKIKTAALVGAGMVATTHVQACAAAHHHVRLKGIAARTSAKADALAREAAKITNAPVCTYASVAEIAREDDVDFALITTPPNARAEIIRPLAEAGKHILLEKPVGRTSKEAHEIVTICREADVTLGVVFQHRARAASVMARQMIEAGTFGALGLAEFNIPWWREQSYYDEPGRGTYARDGGGVLISQAIHTLDLALSLTGPVKSVTAMASTTKFHDMESEDYVVAGLKFANGAVGSFTASTASFPGKAESITLHFERASLHLEAGQLRVSHRDGQVETHGEAAATGGGADPMAFTHAWHQQIIENFVDVLNDSSVLLASGDDALAVHDLIDATMRAATSGKIEHLTP